MLANEFESGELSEKNKVSDIIKAITNAEDYEEDSCKDYLERIEEELKMESEKLKLELEEKRESEKLKLELVEKRESEKLKLEHEARMEQEMLNYKLEKLKIQSSFETVSLTSYNGINKIAPKRMNLGKTR